MSSGTENLSSLKSREKNRSPVDDAAYRRLLADIEATRADRPPGASSLSGEAEQLLYREARLLDARDYKAWLALLAPDFVYWVPSEPAATDARAQCAVNFDDRRRILDRIALIETNLLHAQIPPSRTCRMISNVEAWLVDSGHLETRSNFLTWEHRRGRTSRFVGCQEHRAVKNGEDWLIERKIIRLIDCDEPQGNVSFIL